MSSLQFRLPVARALPQRKHVKLSAMKDNPQNVGNPEVSDMTSYAENQTVVSCTCGHRRSSVVDACALVAGSRTTCETCLPVCLQC